MRDRIYRGGHSPPCFTARRGGCVTKKISRSHLSGRRRGGFPFVRDRKTTPSSRSFHDRSATPPCGEARRGMATPVNSVSRSRFSLALSIRSRALDSVSPFDLVSTLDSISPLDSSRPLNSITPLKAAISNTPVPTIGHFPREFIAISRRFTIPCPTTLSNSTTSDWKNCCLTPCGGLK